MRRFTKSDVFFALACLGVLAVIYAAILAAAAGVALAINPNSATTILSNAEPLVLGFVIGGSLLVVASTGLYMYFGARNK